MMNVWLTFLGMGLVTFGARLAFILLIGKVEVPTALRDVLRFVPPAVLGAIIFLGVMVMDDRLVFSPLENPRLIAAAIAVLVAWRTKKILPTIVVGMVAFWAIQAVLAAM